MNVLIDYIFRFNFLVNLVKNWIQFTTRCSKMSSVFSSIGNFFYDIVYLFHAIFQCWLVSISICVVCCLNKIVLSSYNDLIYYFVCIFYVLNSQFLTFQKGHPNTSKFPKGPPNRSPQPEAGVTPHRKRDVSTRNINRQFPFISFLFWQIREYEIQGVSHIQAFHVILLESHVCVYASMSCVCCDVLFGHFF